MTGGSRIGSQVVLIGHTASEPEGVFLVVQGRDLTESFGPEFLRVRRDRRCRHRRSFPRNQRVWFQGTELRIGETRPAVREREGPVPPIVYGDGDPVHDSGAAMPFLGRVYRMLRKVVCARGLLLR